MLSISEQKMHPLWQRKRLEIMQRDDFTCLVCGAKDKNLQVHHIYYIPGNHLWEYDDDGLKTICYQCHEKITFDMAKLAGHIAWEIITGKRQVP